MRAFVLSGGGSRGALQAGALEVFLEAGIFADVLVGTSVGALNAAYLASEPTAPRAAALADEWRRMTTREMFGTSR